MEGNKMRREAAGGEMQSEKAPMEWFGARPTSAMLSGMADGTQETGGAPKRTEREELYRTADSSHIKLLPLDCQNGETLNSIERCDRLPRLDIQRDGRRLLVLPYVLAGLIGPDESKKKSRMGTYL
jgi:hypothetical protein